MRYAAICLTILLVSCTSEQIPPAATVTVCPQLYHWTGAQVRMLGVEDGELSEGSMAHRAIAEDDYLRAQIESNPACGDNHAAP